MPEGLCRWSATKGQAVAFRWAQSSYLEFQIAASSKMGKLRADGIGQQVPPPQCGIMAACIQASLSVLTRR